MPMPKKKPTYETALEEMNEIHSTKRDEIRPKKKPGMFARP
jgi:hypothetical protein